MIYIDPEIAPRAATKTMSRCTRSRSRNGPARRYDLFLPVNPIYTDLRRGLVRYQQRWGDLPQFQIPAGPAMKLGLRGRATSAALRAAARPGAGRPSSTQALASGGQGISGRRTASRPTASPVAACIASLNLGAHITSG